MNCTVTVYQDSQGRQVLVTRWDGPEWLEAARRVLDCHEWNEKGRRWLVGAGKGKALDEAIPRLIEAIAMATGEVATRDEPFGSWGPPLNLVRSESYTVEGS